MPNENAETLFKEWIVEHRGAVLKVPCAYTRTAEDSQDLAQEILLQVWRSLPQFQGHASATTLVLPGGLEHRACLAPQGTPSSQPAAPPRERRKPTGIRGHRPGRRPPRPRRTALRRDPPADELPLT